MSRFELVAIPRRHWETADGLGIAGFVADALGCERRMAKEVNLDNEYGRYSICCQRLEQSVATSNLLETVEGTANLEPVVRAGRFPILQLAPSYISILAATAGESIAGGFGRSFFPPGTLESHRRAFEMWISEKKLQDTAVEQRVAFFKAAEDVDCGVVELQTTFYPPDGSMIVEDSAPSVENQKEHAFIEIPPFEPTEETTRLLSCAPRKRTQARILREDIRQALKNDQPVTFGNRASHDVITEVLHEFVFVPPNVQPRSAALRVVYADGSEAEPFPVFALRRFDSSKSNGLPLRAALMSMRHLLLDADIDFCWFRNREVSRSRTLAEADEFCFKTTVAQLAASVLQGPLLLHIFHTGFEPAVIGFYRGLVKIMAESRRPAGEVEVVPFYFRSGQPYERGASWLG